MSITDATKKIIGENVRRLRVQSGKNVEELAGTAGVARGYWYEVERAATNPTVEMLELIARALKVSVRDLLEDPDGDTKSKRRKAS